MDFHTTALQGNLVPEFRVRMMLFNKVQNSGLLSKIFFVPVETPRQRQLVFMDRGVTIKEVSRSGFELLFYGFWTEGSERC
ncbi:hypothetical protein GZ78_03710 [Endozoicomonas numazuensis]|uniref:Uncharacterized protein n=1 Tax=Endozoicomonas numazuensis TaxID=1137799 RepID=A0A081NL00_9GAMM|nr:hypothetical protein GZ78_03710 [Endozoicomonas numazuensis]